MTTRNTAPKLPLTDTERVQLRKHKIKLQDITQLEISTLADILQTDHERARTLFGLAQLQVIPSIGPRLAQLIVQLGYYTLADLKHEDGRELIDRFEQQFGYWQDPCVEDSFRCIVHHAKHPDSTKQWFDFTEERKAYRAANGYPANRPKRAWYES